MQIHILIVKLGIHTWTCSTCRATTKHYTLAALAFTAVASYLLTYSPGFCLSGKTSKWPTFLVFFVFFSERHSWFTNVHKVVCSPRHLWCFICQAGHDFSRTALPASSVTWHSPETLIGPYTPPLSCVSWELDRLKHVFISCPLNLWVPSCDRLICCEIMICLKEREMIGGQNSVFVWISVVRHESGHQ